MSRRVLAIACTLAAAFVASYVLLFWLPRRRAARSKRDCSTSLKTACD
jgi:hypothetical protein